MNTLPSFDVHAHLDPGRQPEELIDTGVVLAMTLSLEEATLIVDRQESLVVWGAIHAQARRRKLFAWSGFANWQPGPCS
jgi:hypothetical protein